MNVEKNIQETIICYKCKRYPCKNEDCGEYDEWLICLSCGKIFCPDHYNIDIKSLKYLIAKGRLCLTCLEDLESLIKKTKEMCRSVENNENECACGICKECLGESFIYHKCSSCKISLCMKHNRPVYYQNNPFCVECLNKKASNNELNCSECGKLLDLDNFPLYVWGKKQYCRDCFEKITFTFRKVIE